MMPDFGHVAFNTTAHSYPALTIGDSIEDFLACPVRALII